MFEALMLLSISAAGQAIHSELVDIKTAQDGPFEILSPTPESLIRRGELFIALRIREPEKMKKSSIQIFLDEKEVTDFIKVRDDQVTLLYNGNLGNGDHQVILVSENIDGGKMKAQGWRFYSTMRISNRERRKLGKNVEIAILKNKYLSFVGNVQASTQYHDISGGGGYLRQEPKWTHTLNTAMRLKYRGVAIPMKLFLTSDDNPAAQKNRYMLGLETRFAELHYGDNNPKFDKLVLNGARIRGVHAYVPAGLVNLHYVTGTVRNPIEGDLLKYDRSGAIPPNLNLADSTFVRSGTFKRKLGAIRASFGQPYNIAWGGITLLRSTDDTSSIVNGLQPKQNVVLGADVNINQGKYFRTAGGFALSVTTNDISLGQIDKDELEQTLGVNLSFNPDNIKPFILINTSTYPIALNEGSSMAWFANAQFKLKTNTLTGEYKSIGAAYTSFGNLFLRNDRRGFTITDRLTLFKRKVMLTARYKQYVNDLSKYLSAALKTRIATGNVLVKPHEKAPSFNLGYNLYQRESKAVLDDRYVADHQLHNLFGGLVYILENDRSKTTVSGYYTYSLRDDKHNIQNDNNTQSIIATLDQRFSFPIGFGGNFSQITTTSDLLGAIQDYISYGGHLSLFLLKEKLTVKASARNSHSRPTDYVPESDRLTAQLDVNYKVIDGLTLNLEVGHSFYKEPLNNTNDYNENFGQLQLLYSFNVRTKGKK